jgi:hypothetical protein
MREGVGGLPVELLVLARACDVHHVVSPPPARPKVFHITHVENLTRIVGDGCLFSHAEMLARGGPVETIGMSSIKSTRLQLPVSCHAGLMVGACVPFNLCARSVMLVLIHRANHPELGYRGGQGPIVHLEADLHEVIDWAEGEGRRWALTRSNASVRYCSFKASRGDLADLDWEAIGATDFRDAVVKDRKQAEFLVERRFPWHLVERIGVVSQQVRARASEIVSTATHRPPVEVRREWYY